jgi:hypothetical protein
MDTPHVINHPLRTIEFSIDDSFGLRPDSNHVIELYKRMHDSYSDCILNSEKLSIDLPAISSELKIISEKYEEIKKSRITYLQIIKNVCGRHENYKALRKEIDRQEKFGYEYNHSVFLVEQQFLKLQDKVVSMQKKSIELGKFIAEGSQKQWDEFDEAFDKYQEDHGDHITFIQSLLDDHEKFSKKVEEVQERFIEIYKSIGNLIRQEFNTVSLDYNRAIGVKKLNSSATDVHVIYLHHANIRDAIYHKIYITMDESLKELEYEEFNISITYDVELDEKNKLWLHLGGFCEIDNSFQSYSRASFDLRCKKEEIFTRENLEPLFGYLIDRIKQDVVEHCTQKRIEFNGAEFDSTESLVECFSDDFSNQPPDFPDALPEFDKFIEYITFDSPSFFSFLSVVIVNVIDQLLFFNKKFDNVRNMEKMAEVVSVSFYLTVRNKITDMKPKKIKLDLRQYICFLTLMDCVCQLLVGDHDSDFTEELKKEKCNEEYIIKFLSIAQEHYKEAIDTFKKLDLNILNLKEKRDWNKHFF